VLSRPAHPTQAAGGADQHQTTNHTWLICCELLRDAAAGGHAEDVDRPVELVLERSRVLGRQRAHGQAGG
jgi:hypothetical protein